MTNLVLEPDDPESEGSQQSWIGWAPEDPPQPAGKSLKPSTKREPSAPWTRIPTC